MLCLALAVMALGPLGQGWFQSDLGLEAGFTLGSGPVGLLAWPNTLLFSLCYRPAAEKPGFVPPRELSKHSPLIKSPSLSSIQKGRGQEEEATVLLRPPRDRHHVQRTQSVPAQSKATRRPRKQSSLEHVAESVKEESRKGSPCHGPQDNRSHSVSMLGAHGQGSGLQPPPLCLRLPPSACGGLLHPPWGPTCFAPHANPCPVLQGRSKLRQSASLPRKSTVPWQRYSGEAAKAQTELYTMRPLEKVTGLSAKDPFPLPAGAPGPPCCLPFFSPPEHSSWT